ncbi:MAG: ABC transporter permease [Actinobacteria bacterium]|nr:ABC transporter permease [Actinomycetota bacterium]
MNNKKILNTISNYKLVILMIFIIIVVAIFSPLFFKLNNLLNTLSYLSVNGIISIGLTLLMISKYFDLSVGSILGLSGAISVITVNSSGSPVLGIMAGLISGIILGLLNGLIVTKMKINSFIATLGTMVIYQGITFAITNSRAISSNSIVFQKFSTLNIFNIPIIIIYFVVVILAIWLISRFTKLGKFAYAIGGNPEACRGMGIKVESYVLILYILSGFCASFAGVVLSSSILAASGTFGNDIVLVIIASVIIGGVRLSGGIGSVWGVVQGIVLIGLIENVTVFLGFYGNWQLFFRSILLLAVVIFDIISYKQAMKISQKRELELLLAEIKK